MDQEQPAAKTTPPQPQTPQAADSQQPPVPPAPQPGLEKEAAVPNGPASLTQPHSTSPTKQATSAEAAGVDSVLPQREVRFPSPFVWSVEPELAGKHCNACLREPRQSTIPLLFVGWGK